MSITRRDLLHGGALAVAVSACPIPGRAFAGTPSTGSEASPFRLGVCSYSFRDFDRAHVIDFMKQLGTRFLNAKNVKDHLPMTPPEATLKAVSDYTAAGIELTGAGTIYFPKDEDDDIRQKFDYCKRAGISLIIAGDPAPQTLPRIEKFVKEYDIRFAIHNHGPEDKLWPSPLDVLKAMKNMDPRMGSCMDVGHASRAGTDVVSAIRKVGPRLFDVHIKDLTNFQSEDSQVPVGDGLMPVRGIFQSLMAIGYKGDVDLEYEVQPDNPLPGMIKSLAYMRGVLAGMGYKA